MEYAITHEGKSFGPSGQLADVPADKADEYNRELEQREIEWLKTAPEKVMLYVSIVCLCDRTVGSRLIASANGRNSRAMSVYNGDDVRIQTWKGTSVATHVSIGERVNGGLFGWHTYKRSVSCRLYGVKYHGWFMESSGDYCRLRKAKVQ